MNVKELFYSIFPSPSKYLTYKKGNSPIILSAPHGGGIIPRGVPHRTYGNRGKDSYTRSLIQKVIYNLSIEPYYIYSDIHRKIVDLNRNINEGAQGGDVAKSVWNLWHKTLYSYLNDVRANYGRGLYIDIHSHDKSRNFEIGIDLTASKYLKLKNRKITRANSSLYPLVKRGIVSEYDLIFGGLGIASSFERNGYKVLVPKNDSSYLNGGYNIIKHRGNGIGAIQIECPIDVLREDLDGVASTITGAINLINRNYL